MQVHVKAPNIDVHIQGQGVAILLQHLKCIYPDIEISDDDEVVPLATDVWFKELRATRTPGKVLACYRDNAGITIEELSERSGIAKSWLFEMENNKRPIELKVAKKLAETLGCDFQRFLIA